MALKHVQEYRDADIARHLAAQIRDRSRQPVRMMEVCGTHTVSIFRSGLRSLLPETITLISGPGCPVCVTDQAEIDAFVALAREPGVIAATFGDLMRVPGTESSLQRERAAGRDVRIVYSAFDALKLARAHPDRQVVFFGVGFETTAPTVAATVMTAAEAGLENFSVWSAHKTVPAALDALMGMPEVAIDAFLLPGHVSVIIGTEGYRPFFQRHRMPCVVAGFEPADLLAAVAAIIDQVASGTPALANAYPRAVVAEGNPKALAVMNRVFAPVDAAWRGLGTIAGSGLEFTPAFDRFNARHRFVLHLPVPVEPKGCACGQILTGAKRPPECPLFGTRCTPMDPVGPCMVSSEGTCAAYYRYAGRGNP
ncbi:MAG: hydrogenase formation protein HypD [Desulfobacterales bacterium]|jgi:hydrogenase expression/formation protein HypD|nr:hydrogenase formation protein HypD [Desulfobacteraceae bacterium]MDD3990678.1 hydrogenase formation protein HypD [Desulfobacteraceae bacterium]MDY0311052.1 hydrogenase formation protein HypD [Desulfobacterales bacterium]